MWVSLLHKTRQGPIWIVGSDPTLDDYPDNFLDEKVGITLNRAYFKFPNAAYRLVVEGKAISRFMTEDPEFFTKTNLYCYPPYYPNDYPDEPRLWQRFWGYKFGIELYAPTGARGNVKDGYTRRKTKQALAGTTNSFGAHGTCLHPALWIAIMMGGNPINIIGCALGLVKGKKYAESTRSENKLTSDWAFKKEHMKAPIDQVKAIIKAAKKQRVIINWKRKYEG
jgi:hypothetical protein